MTNELYFLAAVVAGAAWAALVGWLFKRYAKV